MGGFGELVKRCFVMCGFCVFDSCVRVWGGCEIMKGIDSKKSVCECYICMMVKRGR